MSTQAATPGASIDVWIWRHPMPIGVSGRCIGRTDVAVDARRSGRLAHRIATAARRAGLPREIWTSPLRRCCDAGRALTRLGFAHRVDVRLAELDFGRWDGRPWAAIDRDEVAAWEADFANHRPGGGESLASLMHRAREFLLDHASRAGGQSAPLGSQGDRAAPALLVVGHAGWINAARLLDQPLQAASWPAAPAYGSLVRLRLGP